MGRFRSPEQVADVILTQSPDGSPVYIHDVAEVRKGFKKPSAVVKNFGTACMAINCVRETGANVLDVMEGLRQVNADLNRNLLKREGLELVQVYDQTDYIYSAVGLVNQNIVVGGILTVAVLLLFLRSGRSTIVIALAIPASLVGTFLMLNLMGRSLNVISLAGLAFAVGMLVDNAVVVLENCYQPLADGRRSLRGRDTGHQRGMGGRSGLDFDHLGGFSARVVRRGRGGTIVSGYRPGHQFRGGTLFDRVRQRDSHGGCPLAPPQSKSRAAWRPERRPEAGC